MKELISLALIAMFSLLSQTAFSQSIILINGQPTKVVLKGEHIEKIVNQKINDHLREYGQTPEKNFKYASLRHNENTEQKTVNTEKEKPAKDKDNFVATVESINRLALKEDK